jgi:hypothetical protein
VNYLHIPRPPVEEPSVLTPRDRLLAGLLALQLLGAAVLGGILVHALTQDDDRHVTVRSVAV